MHDACPAIPNTDQLDTDGDGVGDVCDPEPTIPRQSLALFTAFWDSLDGWDTHGDPNVSVSDAGGLHYSGSSSMGASLSYEIPLADVDVWAFYRIIATVQPTPNQISLIAAGSGATYYYGNVYDPGTTPPFIAASHCTRSTCGGIEASTLPDGIHAGVLELHVQYRTSPPTIALHGGWPGEPYVEQGSAPLYTGGTELTTYLDGFEVVLDAVMVVATN